MFLRMMEPTKSSLGVILKPEMTSKLLNRRTGRLNDPGYVAGQDIDDEMGYADLIC